MIMNDLYTYATVLTGGIATGKSTVAKMLEKEGFSIIDADKVAHSMLDLHAEDIAMLFGEGILKEGAIDRKALGNIVFSDAQARQKLENFLHPLIREEIESQASVFDAHKLPYIIDIPLFFETKSYDIKEVALVYAPLKIQRERLMARDGFSKEQADNRLNAQISIELKKAQSSYIIDNSQDMLFLEDEVAQFITHIRSKYADSQV